MQKWNMLFFRGQRFRRRQLVVYCAMVFTGLLIISRQQDQQTVHIQSQWWTTIFSKQPEGSEIVGLKKGLTLPDELPTGIKYPGKPKLILSLHSEFNQEFLGGCPDWNCEISTDFDRKQEADAVIMGNPDLTLEDDRKSEQYFVFFTQESPTHYSVDVPYPSFFNLTMGYRRDADLPCPYGYTIRRKATLKSFGTTQLSKKRKAVAWVVSNCAASSKRDQYVRELQRYIPVDVYGSCGSMICPRDPRNACFDQLTQDYRFYLALENSVCKDYITEKFWKSVTFDMVPIVLKRSMVEPYVPSQAFLALDDFESPRHLAKYLNASLENDQLYLRHHEWKIRFDIKFLDGVNHNLLERPWGFCQLCNLLWQQPRPEKILEDFRKWWVVQSECDDNFVESILLRSRNK